MMFRWSRLIALAFLGFTFTQGVAEAGILYVADMGAFGGGGGIIAVDPTTGKQRVVSSGGYLVDPRGLALAQDGDLWVTDAGSHSIIDVNPVTGLQRLLSSGGYLNSPTELLIAPDRSIFVVDPNSLDWQQGAVVRVNPTTGAQTLVSSGGYFVTPDGIALASNGSLLVSDRGAQSSPLFPDGEIIRVDPSTGAQTLIATGGLLRNPDHMAVEADGSILAADHDAFGALGGVIRINPLSGAQAGVSSNGYFGQGPSGIALGPSGDAFVSDISARVIVRVDLSTGEQTLVSSRGYFTHPVGVIYVSAAPEPSTFFLAIIGGFSAVGFGFRRRRA